MDGESVSPCVSAAAMRAHWFGLGPLSGEKAVAHCLVCPG
jgi:hypothetical protein